jgi:putative peptide zinc metalloprotease protein
MTTLRRRAIAAATLLACAAPFGVAQAQDAATESQTRKQDNIAVATTEQDGTRAFDFAWSLRRQRGGVVDHRNIANAAARCSDCRATAIAFQVVLATGSPSPVTPRNQAVAINDQCTRCVVYAGARQFVRVVAGEARFTGKGLATLFDVRRDLRALEGQDLGVAALTAAVEAQEARVVQVLTDEVVTSSGERSRVRDRDDSQADDG